MSNGSETGYIPRHGYDSDDYLINKALRLHTLLAEPEVRTDEFYRSAVRIWKASLINIERELNNRARSKAGAETQGSD